MNNIIGKINEIGCYVCKEICKHIDYHDEKLSEEDMDELEAKYCTDCPVEKLLLSSVMTINIKGENHER